MNTEDDFITAICEQPADDTLRLVFADWLDEVAGRHTERAEFIRVQVELSRLPTCDAAGGIYCSTCQLPTGYGRYVKRCRGAVCRLRMREYYTSRRYLVWDWCRGIPAGSWNKYCRGFVESVTCTVADFMAHAGAMFSTHPITRVTLTDREPDLFDLGDRVPRVWNTHENVVLGAARSLLPSDLFDLLPEPHDPAEFTCAWAGRDTAHALDALSVACVRYGRRLAGLPDLTRAQVAPPAVPTQQGED